MPRQTRLDAPGALDHVMGRDIDGIKIFKSKADRNDFLTDERILGGSEFVQSIISGAEHRDKETLRLFLKISDLSSLAREIVKRQAIADAEVRSGNRKKGLVKARKLFSQIAVKKMGYSGAEVARFLGVTTSAVSRLANSEELSDVGRYI